MVIFNVTTQYLIYEIDFLEQQYNTKIPLFLVV